MTIDGANEVLGEPASPAALPVRRSRRIGRSTVALAGGQVAAQALSLVRNVIVARLLGPEHLGVAATLIVVLSLVEMASELSGEKMLIQADDGDEPTFQEVVQLATFLRGVAFSLVLLALALPSAWLFDVPDARGAFLCLAAYPLLRGLAHLDTVRWQRGLRFGPHVAVETGVHAVLALAAWPLCVWLGDHRAVLWILLAQAGVQVLGTHALARRRYRWRWHAPTLRRIASFGWPLAINGGLLFMIAQGDHLLVGSFWSMTTLGLYAAAFALTAAPTLLLSRISNMVLLPLLSRRRSDAASFATACEQGARVLSALAAVVAVGFLLAGPVLARWVYGPEFEAAGAIMGWLGVMQAVRLVRMAPTQAAIALGDTRNSLLANCWRMSALALALPAAALGADVAWIAIAGALGEVVALGSTIVRLRRRQGLDAGLWMRSILPMAAIVGLTVAGQAAGVPAWALAAALAAAGVGTVAGLGVEADGRAGLAGGGLDPGPEVSG